MQKALRLIPRCIQMATKLCFISMLCQASLLKALAPIVINIDNPNFRKLITAVPAFKSEGAGAQVVDFAKIATEDLAKLLEFTEYFRMMPTGGYSNITAKPFSDTKSLPGFADIDLLAWKGIKVDSLTNGAIKVEGKGFRINLKSADINTSVIMLEMSYVFSTKNELEAILRRYTDLLLVKYTGKPGIYTSRIVFIGKKTKASDPQIYTCDVDGQNLKQMTNNKTIHLSPSWSPDGSKIVFTSYAANNPDLYLLDLMTNKSTRIASKRGINSGGTFTPSGKIIAYSGSVGADTEIFLRLDQKNDRVPFLSGNKISVDPIFSPDGKWLAFVSGKFGNPHIFRVALEWSPDKAQVRVDTKAEEVEKQLTYAGWWNANPAWSPDSSKIAFAGFDKEINRFDIFVMNSEGKEMERLTSGTGRNVSPTWSPNGQMILFESNRVGNSNVMGKSNIYLMNRDGSNQRQIETGLYESMTPKWGPYLDKEFEAEAAIATAPVIEAKPAENKEKAAAQKEAPKTPSKIIKKK